MGRLVVTGDSNVNKSQRRLGVAESNNRDVDIGSLSDWLMVSVRVGDNKETRFTECSLKLKIKEYK